jgi:hypothetical protein
MLDNSGSKAVMPRMVRMFGKTARQRIRPEGGDHRRVLARRGASKSLRARFESSDRSPGCYRHCCRAAA